MEDILKRLGNVETDVSELKTQVGAILATIPHLATKADVLEVKKDVANLRAEMAAEAGSLRSEMAATAGALRAEMAATAGALRSEMGALRAEMAAQWGSLKAEMAAQYGSLRTEMAARETAFIKWMIGTVLTTAGLAFTIAKWVH